MKVGDAVEARRLDLKLTQEGLAERAGVSSRTVHNLENAKTWPQTSNRRAIERALGWGPGSLQRIRDGGEPFPVDKDATQEPGEGPGSRPEVDGEVMIPAAWLVSILLSAAEVDRHRQFAAREILGLDEGDQGDFSSSLEELLRQTRQLVEEVESGAIKHLGGMRGAAKAIRNTHAHQPADRPAPGNRNLNALSDSEFAPGYAGSTEVLPPTDSAEPSWRGKSPAEMTDDELREAAGGDEVWADYLRTKRPELVDWDF